jgi:4'-phosphopantetheinyl transferase EntD
MLERILPPSVAVVATRTDLEATLYPEEEAVVQNAVEKRRREFVTARTCARQALAELGLPPQAIPCGAKGEPVWPDGAVGSITHCDGYRAAAVARTADLLTLGVDTEPNLPLPEGLLGDVSLPDEREWLRRLSAEAPLVNWDRLLFCLKESIYKAWFPLAERWLGFEDARVTIDVTRGTFAANLLVRGPALGAGELRSFRGRWLAADGLLLAAIALPASDFGYSLGNL